MASTGRTSQRLRNSSAPLAAATFGLAHRARDETTGGVGGPAGQSEPRGRDRRRGRDSLDHPVLLEIAEAIGQQVRGDAGQAVPKIGVASLAPDQQLPHDEQAPPVTDRVQRQREPAELIVRTHRNSHLTKSTTSLRL